MRYRNDPDGTRLPIKLDTTTNGEFAPIPLAPVHHRARNARARGRRPPTRKRLGLDAPRRSWSRRAARRPRCSP